MITVNTELLPGQISILVTPETVHAVSNMVSSEFVWSSSARVKLVNLALLFPDRDLSAEFLTFVGSSIDAIVEEPESWCDNESKEPIWARKMSFPSDAETVDKFIRLAAEIGLKVAMIEECLTTDELSSDSFLDALAETKAKKGLLGIFAAQLLRLAVRKAALDAIDHAQESVKILFNDRRDFLTDESLTAEIERAANRALRTDMFARIAQVALEEKRIFAVTGDEWTTEYRHERVNAVFAKYGYTALRGKIRPMDDPLA